MTTKDDGRETGSLRSFLGSDPTRSLDDWHDLFTRDRAFPIESDRPIVGTLLVWFRRLLRPLVRLPQNDLWERQRVFNLIVLERLRTVDSLDEQVQALSQRLSSLEASYKEGLDEVMRYNDALFSRVDGKLDGHSETVRQTLVALKTASQTEDTQSEAGPMADLASRIADAQYLAFENRERGSRVDIRSRVEAYWEDLEVAERVLDLGCGRGEVLQFLTEQDVEAVGVDGSGAMVNYCREHDLQAVQADLNDYLARAESASFDAITSFHVIEHLGSDQLTHLLEQALRVLRPGGLVVLETPNPESLIVGASRFWVDRTHVKPLHPTALRTAMEEAGFRSVEVRPCHPFPNSERLPEVDCEGLEGPSQKLAGEVNRLRDRIDAVLFGEQDYAAIARK